MSNPRYRYIKNHKDNAVLTFGDPSQAEATLPGVPKTVKTKLQYRKWGADAKTNSVFFNTIEGDNPNARVVESNPVRFVHGFVADYDVPQKDIPTAIKAIKDRIKKTDSPLPTWVSMTFSSGVRLVWEFEKPLPLDPRLAKMFFATLTNKLLKASSLLPGYDATCEKPTQYFALGTNWTKLGPRLKPNDIHQIVFTASNNVVIETEETNIPLEEVEKELHRRFPGRWSGPFEVGQRGPLFWVDDGVDRHGCQVRENGMTCYSDRAGKGFMSWGEIFGKKFVSKYEKKKVNRVANEFWTDGKNYFKEINGVPQEISKEHLNFCLKKLGFSARNKKGQQVSELEEAVGHINEFCRVEGIAPMVFSKEKIVEFAGRRILNCNTRRPIQPASHGHPKDWRFIRKLLWNFFSKDPVTGQPTLPYFLAWLQRFYGAVLYYREDQGQMLILIGESGRGKTLISNRLIGGATGGFADASEYLCGKTTFTKELGGAPTWVVDDNKSFATYADHRKFLELTKRAVANPRMEYQAKFGDAHGIPWCGRVIMSLNTDPNSLAALPSMDSSNRDKILALRVNGDFQMDFPSNAETERLIREQMPYFLHWLIHKFKAPDWVLDPQSRFGVKTYIDPVIEGAAFDNSNRSMVGEIVDFFAKRFRDQTEGIRSDPDHWCGTLTDFQTLVHELNNGRTVGKSHDLDFIRRGMAVIEENCRHNALMRPVRSVGHGQGKVWYINLTEKFDIVKSNGAPHTAGDEHS